MIITGFKMAKIKDHYYNDASTSSEPLIRHLMVKQLAEYRVETTTLRELLTMLHEQVEKEYDIMPTSILRQEYNKLFNQHMGD